MKKCILLLLTITMLTMLTACGNESQSVDEISTNELDSIEPTNYYSEETTSSNEEADIENESSEDYEKETLEKNPQIAITGALHRVEYGDNVAYLFGTMHASRPNWFPLADIVEDALRRSNVLAIEFTTLEMSGNEIRNVIRNVTYLPDEERWYDIFSADVYEHLVETIQTWNVRFGRSMNPVHIMFHAENMLSFDLANLSRFNTVDSYLEGVARALEIPIIGLATMEQQVSLLYNVPFDVMLDKIAKFMSREEFAEAFTYSPNLIDLAEFYENNDFVSINEITRIDPQCCLYCTYIVEVLFKYRTTNFANQVIRLLQETEEPTTFFVGIGFSHIIGSGRSDEFTDIVELLELAGFEPQPLW
ncbi:MAG: TraB/GumN family protein [Oscillospiraceae bacterium]|nr:TraB/GumN family protein [Oscillospiraceae bacterium]